MDYLDLVEEFQNGGEVSEYSQFDKVLTLVARTSDLYDGKSTTLKNIGIRKPTTIAQLEFNNGLIEHKLLDANKETATTEFDNDME